MNTTEDINNKIRTLLHNLRDPDMALKALEDAKKDPVRDVSEFAQTLLMMYDITGPENFPKLVEELISQYESVIAGKPLPSLSEIENDVCAGRGLNSPKENQKVFNFEEQLQNTIESICALYQASLPTKRYGYGVNMEDYRVSVTFSRGLTYGLSITLASDAKKAVCRQLGSSPQDLIKKCDAFLTTMLTNLNKNKVKVAN